MKNVFPYLTITAAFATCLAVACGGSDSDSGAGNTNAGGSSAAGSSAAGTTGAGKGGAAGKAGTAGKAGSGTAECTGLLMAGTCATCIEGKCCAELAACNDDGACLMDCLSANAPAECAMNEPLKALDACLSASCMTECSSGPAFSPSCDAPATAPSMGSCGKTFKCNPVTNEGCAAGSACDVAQGGFDCYADGNVKALCEMCGSSDADFCKAGLNCADGKCARYCCDDSDCGSGKCDKASIMGNGMGMVGICASGSGAGGAAGAGGSGSAGKAGSGTAGSGTAGSGTAGAGMAAGSGTAGTGTAGAAGSDAGAAGTGTAGAAGSDAGAAGSN